MSALNQNDGMIVIVSEYPLDGVYGYNKIAWTGWTTITVHVCAMKL